MTMLNHLNNASENLQDALDACTVQAEREELQTLLDRVNSLIASEEAMNRRDHDERLAR